MAQLNYILWFIFTFISVKRLESSKIYIVNLDDEVVATPNDYNDVIPVNNYEILDVQSQTRTNSKINSPERIQDDNEMKSNSMQRYIFLCHKRFTEENSKQLKRCLERVKNNGRTNGHTYFKKPSINFYPEYSIVENLHKNKRLLDLSTFSRDYIDFRDLGRSDSFADDYIDINDFRSTLVPECNQNIDEFGTITTSKCIPSRKHILVSTKEYSGVKKAIEDQNDNDIQARSKNKHSNINSDSSSPSSKSSDENNSYEIQGKSTPNSEDYSLDKEDVPSKKQHQSSKRKRKNITPSKHLKRLKTYKLEKGKPRRYKVISYQTDVGDSNDYGRKKHYFSSSRPSGFSSEPEYYPKSDFSAEITTKKPSKKGIEDKYMLLQGNKFYGSNDFRRRRLPHFLPKRYHWDSDEYQNLGYYWFQGPRGKYHSPLRTEFD